MADISNLQVQITANTTQANNSIDKLIGKLTELNKALNNYGNNSAYIRGLFNLAGGLSQVGNAANGIDSSKISSFATALDNLYKAGSNLSDLNFSALGTGLRNIQSVNISGDKFAGLKTLSESLGKLVGVNYEKAKTALPTLAKSLSSFQKINIPNFGGKIEALASGLGKLGGKYVVKAQDIHKIADGLRAFENIDVPDLTGMKDLATVLSKFGYKNMTQATQQMPLLAENFTKLMTAVASAPQVSTQTLRFAEAMAKLSASAKSAGVNMNGVTNGTSSFRTSILRTLPTMNRVKRSTFSLAAMFGKLYASYFLVIRAFRGLGKAISVSSALTEVENVVASVFNNMSDKLDDFADTSMYKFGLAELSAKQYASRFQAMGNAMGITTKQVADSTDFLSKKLVGQKRDIEGVEDSYSDLGDSMADMSINLTKLVSDYASFFNMDYDDVAKDFESIFTGSTRPMRAYGIDLTNATLKEWALKNGLDADVKSMTQAEKSMLRYQYVMAQSGKVMNDYQITMNNWANVTRTIGQQFTKLGSIIGQGLINTFKPVLIAFRNFMNTIIDLTQKALNAIGKLLGWQIEIEEVGFAMDNSMDDYADAIDDAAGSAKKLNAQLRSIDELNNLTSNNGKGGSGDDSLLGTVSGGESGASGGQFRFEKYQSDIDSWFELGKRISDKITEALNSINWGNIFSKARNFGKNLAEYLNGVISPESFYAVGKTIANAINTAIEAAYSFGTNFNFKNLGESIANGINGFFGNFNFAKLAKTINKWVEGLKKTITTLIKKIKWDKVFSGLFDFFSNLSFDSYLLIGVANLTKIVALFQSMPVVITKITSLFSTLSGNVRNVAIAFDNMYSNSGGNKIKAINAGIEQMTWGLTGVQKALIGIGSAAAEFALLDSGVKNLILDSENLGESITKMISGIIIGAAGLTAVIGFPYGLIAAGIIGITGALVGLKQGLDELNQIQLADSIKEAFTNDSGVPLDEYLNSITTYVKGLGDGFELVTEKSNTLQSARKNVEDVVFEIQRIKTEMDAGVKSVEKGTEELNTLFGELQTAMETKLQAAAGVLYATFSEDGVIGRTYEYTAEKLQETKEEVAKQTSEMENSIAELYTKLQEAEPGSDEWQKYYEQLIQAASGMDEVDKSLMDLHASVEKNGLDWSMFFDEDGLNVEDVKGHLNTIFTEVDGVSTALRTTVDNAKSAAAELGMSDLYMDLETNYPKALGNMNKEASVEIQKATDALQTELIGGLNKVVEDAQADWEKNKIWYKILGKDEESFVRDRAAKYVSENIDPISSEIETKFKGLSIEGAGWASDAAREMISKMFYGVSVDDVGNGFDALTGVFENASSLKLEPSLTNIGNVCAEDIIQGYIDGIKEISESEISDATSKVVDETEDGIRDAADSHSPARRFNPVGKDIVLGIFEGFELVDFNKEMTKWWNDNVQPWFTSYKWEELGLTAKDGLVPAINNMNTEIYNNISATWDNIYKYISSSIEKIKGLTNFEWSLPNIKVPHFEISGEFDLKSNKVPSIDVNYYAQGGFPQTGSLFYAGEAGAELLGTVGGKTTVAGGAEITGISDTIRQTSSEEIALLRQQNQLLQGILQKEFGISKNELYKSVRSSDREFRGITGRSGFAY